MGKNKNQNAVDPTVIIEKESNRISSAINSYVKNDGPVIYTQKANDVTNPKMLQSVMDAVMIKLKSKVAVMIVSCCERNVYINVHAPGPFGSCECTDSDHARDVREWLVQIIKTNQSFQVKGNSAQITASQELSAFKLVDQVIATSYAFLKKKDYIMDAESDDEDYSAGFFD
jgi:hypothetical protein